MIKYSKTITAGLCLGLLTFAAPSNAAPYSSSFIHDSAPTPSIVHIDHDANGETHAKAEKLITSISTKGIQFLSNPGLTETQKKREFDRLLKRNFDLKTIGRFALGRYWRTATSAEKAEYLILFENMVTDVYSSRFSEYTDQKIEVQSSQPTGKSDILVRTLITGKGQPDIQLDWRVRNKGGQYKVIDVMVEGVSMAVTQRSDFSSVIQRGGGKVSVLIDHLKSR